MVDRGDKGLRECEREMSSCSSNSNSNSSGVTNTTNEGGKLRTCADCGTTKTPLWRSGPAGPKSLCNACGIRSRKKRRALLGLNKTSAELKRANKINTSIIVGDDTNSSVKTDFFAFRVPLTWQKTKVRRKLGEEERAAMLLMALSCGSVY